MEILQKVGSIFFFTINEPSNDSQRFWKFAKVANFRQYGHIGCGTVGLAVASVVWVLVIGKFYFFWTERRNKEEEAKKSPFKKLQQIVT